MANKIVINDLDAEIQRKLSPPPGRGRAVLSMAIFGLLGCPVFSVTAWAWGRRELKRLEKGEANPREEGRLRAAIILAWVSILQMLVIGLPLAIGAVLVYKSLLTPGQGGPLGPYKDLFDILKDLH